MSYVIAGPNAVAAAAGGRVSSPGDPVFLAPNSARQCCLILFLNDIILCTDPFSCRRGQSIVICYLQSFLDGGEFEAWRES